jgi:hypothetical protein
MTTVAGIDEPVKGNGPRLSVGVKEAGDPLGAIARAEAPLAVARRRVQPVVNPRPAIQGNGLRHRPIEDVAGDPLDPEATAQGIGAIDCIQVGAKRRVHCAE